MRFLLVVATAAVIWLVTYTLFNNRTYDILEAPTYTNGDDAAVKFRVRKDSGEPFVISVPVECVEVRPRADGENHASLACAGVVDAEKRCATATILVPQEDVAAWQAEVNRWKALRKPPHVVPKPPSDNR